jgi:hypothetical protein
MAYDLHITRKDKWVDKDPLKEITREEWDNLKTTGALVSLGNPNYPDEKYAKNPEIYPEVYFTYRNGNITCHGPDDASIQIMKHIAAILGAKVQGDDDELY